MAKIVFGLGTSHGPLLTAPPDKWEHRANDDRNNTELCYRDGTYNFAELAELRRAEKFEDQNTLQVRTERFNRCQAALDKLAQRIAAVEPDVLVIIGDDQREWFFPDAQPPFAVYHGDAVTDLALTEAEKEDRRKRDREYSILMYHPPEDKTYACADGLAEAIVTRAIEDEFDVTACGEQPKNGGGVRNLGHAYAFVCSRLLRYKPAPIVPILLNTFYPPNQATPKRCYDFGRSIGRAIREWDGDTRVAVIASGGLSHFVVDEPWDHKMIKAMQDRDIATLTHEPNIIFRSGTSETKNWISTIGALESAERPMDMELIDYVPCYRTEAGTGSGMGFAVWE